MKQKTPVVMFLFALIYLFSCDASFAGVMIVGTEKSFPPFAFEEDGELAGFEIDLVEKITERLKTEAKFVDIAFDALVPALTEGRIDMIAAGMNVTPERHAQIDFSRVYCTSSDVAVMRSDAEETTALEELRGLAVAVQFGTVQDQHVSGMKEIVVQRYQRTTDALRAVLEGKAAAAVIDEPVAREYLRTEEDLGKLLRIAFSLEGSSRGMAFGFRKGDRELREAVDGVIVKMEEDGSLEALREKWFLPFNR